MKLLVIGSKGFIGCHAAVHFLAKGDTVIGYDLVEADGSEQYNYYSQSEGEQTLYKIFKQYLPDACINAGGNGSVPLSINDPGADFIANVLFHSEILELIRKHQPGCKYVHLSSAAVYGNPQQLPIDENIPVKPLSPYGWHKYQAEILCREYAVLFEIRTISLRVFSVYGPGLRKQLFWDSYQKSKQNDTIRLFGTGGESRDFIYISDLIEAIDTILENALMKGQVINVSSGIETTIAEAIEIFIKLLRNNNIIEFTNQENPGNPLNWRADVKVLTSLGFTAKTDLYQGLNSTVKWLKENA